MAFEVPKWPGMKVLKKQGQVKLDKLYEDQGRVEMVYSATATVFYPAPTPEEKLKFLLPLRFRGSSELVSKIAKREGIPTDKLNAQLPQWAYLYGIPSSFSEYRWTFKEQPAGIIAIGWVYETELARWNTPRELEALRARLESYRRSGIKVIGAELPDPADMEKRLAVSKAHLFSLVRAFKDRNVSSSTHELRIVRQRGQALVRLWDYVYKESDGEEWLYFEEHIQVMLRLAKAKGLEVKVKGNVPLPSVKDVK